MTDVAEETEGNTESAPAVTSAPIDAATMGEPRVTPPELAEAVVAIQRRRDGESTPIIGRVAIREAAQSMGCHVSTEEILAEVRARRVSVSVAQSPENRKRRRRSRSGSTGSSARQQEREKREKRMRLAYGGVFGLALMCLTAYMVWQQTPASNVPAIPAGDNPRQAFRMDPNVPVLDTDGGKPVVRTLEEARSERAVKVSADQLHRIVRLKNDTGFRSKDNYWTVIKHGELVYLRGWLEKPVSDKVLTGGNITLVNKETDANGEPVGDAPTPVNLRADSLEAAYMDSDLTTGGRDVERLIMIRVAPDARLRGK